VFDYGAPVGFGIAARHPERITAIISQNGNVYEEGLSDGWNPVQAYWKDPSPANRDAIRTLLEPQTTIWQCTHGVVDLVAGSGITFEDRGEHQLKGVPGPWRLFAVTS
jgi:pimeloyl-ACP methyl ester carboxylesterase